MSEHIQQLTSNIAQELEAMIVPARDWKWDGYAADVRDEMATKHELILCRYDEAIATLRMIRTSSDLYPHVVANDILDEIDQLTTDLGVLAGLKP